MDYGSARAGATRLAGAVALVAMLAAGAVPDAHAQDDTLLIVSIRHQTINLYRGGGLVESSRVSTGKKGYATPTGVFSILQKNRFHRSNIYSRAPMPFMQRLTWSGVALHAGPLPGYPASHGCIRLTNDFAARLFAMTRLGAHVLVVEDKASPTAIEHAALFRPVAPTVPLPRQAPAATSEGPTSRPLLASAAPDATLIRLASLDAPEAELGDGASDDGDALDLGPPSTSPLRILVTRRTGRERTRDAQRMLRDLGHDPGDIDGLMGPATGAAIKAFQTANGLAPTGALTPSLIENLFRATGGDAVPPAHIYVRQDFRPIFDAPVGLRDPERPLGSHFFVAGRAASGASQMTWRTVELRPGQSTAATDALDRLDIPDAIRRALSERLTPGSSLVLSDDGISGETAPGVGTDFVVLTP